MANHLFRAVSRLGDGVIWYGLLSILALLGGLPAAKAMLHVGLTALLGVVIYGFLKNRLVRQRPFISHGEIICRIAPLDQYSFPSGHTLHAVLFTIMFIHYAPALAAVLVPFAILVALSRVVLGLHYPSDVLVGAVLGGMLAYGSLWLLPMPAVSLPADIVEWQSGWML
ncbi:MAG: phosphatase PAP2 family protein [Pseudomonadota bacterium]